MRAALPARLLWFLLPLGLCLFPLASQAADCAAPEPVCAARAAVFPLSSFSPVGSAVRIGEGELVTSRHVVADETKVLLFLPGGGRTVAEVVPSDFADDLVLLRAALPPGPLLEPAAAAEVQAQAGPLYVVGADPAAGQVRVFAPGPLHALPDPALPLSRLHHGAEAVPGSSGGALLDGAGRLLGIVAAGGEGRNEAVPAWRLDALREASGAGQGTLGAAIGRAVRACQEGLERLALQRARRQPAEAAALESLEADCRATGNRQYWDDAAQALAAGGRLEAAVALFVQALEQDPEALNSRIGYAVALQLARRWDEGHETLTALLEQLPHDAQVLRLAVQAGVRGDAPDLAERAYTLLARHHPAQAEAARRFIDAGPSASREPAP